MIRIKITEAMKAKAQRLADAKLESVNKIKASNYTGLEEENRYYIGMLGEVAFETLLRKRRKRFSRPVASDYHDNGDFVLYLESSIATVDVKTCSKSFHEYMMIPSAQLSRYDYSAYIGVRIIEDIAEIWGFANKSELNESVKSKVNSQDILLKDLRDIEQLLERISNE